MTILPSLNWDSTRNAWCEQGQVKLVVSWLIDPENNGSQNIGPELGEEKGFTDGGFTATGVELLLQMASGWEKGRQREEITYSGKVVRVQVGSKGSGTKPHYQAGETFFWMVGQGSSSDSQTI